jgi:hypothetical protein
MIISLECCACARQLSPESFTAHPPTCQWGVDTSMLPKCSLCVGFQIETLVDTSLERAEIPTESRTVNAVERTVGV